MKIPKRPQGILPKVALYVFLLTFLAGVAGCTAESGSLSPIGADSGTQEAYPAPTAEMADEEAQSIVNMSRAALASHLGVDESAIELESVVEPTTAGETTVVMLRADGQEYEYHGRNGEVMLVSEPLPMAPTVDVSLTPAGESPQGGVDLSVADEVAADYDVAAMPASSVGADMPPWSAYPDHIVFNLTGYGHTDSLFRPQITIYPLAELTAVNQTAADEVTVLQEILSAQPDLASSDRLPYLPATGAAQMLHAREAYLDFGSGQGLRFLTHHGQAAGPINNSELLYTFQGITDGGEYYVSAIFPIAQAGLPSGSEAESLEVGEDYQAYLDAIVTELNEADASSFTPDLEALDALIQSITIPERGLDMDNYPVAAAPDDSTNMPMPPLATPSEGAGPPTFQAEKIDIGPEMDVAEIDGHLAASETDRYFVEGQEGQILTLTLTSPENDALLAVFDPSGRQLTRYEAGPPTSTMQLSESGKYLIELASGGSDTDYTLQAWLDAPTTEGSEEPVTFGVDENQAQVEGALASGSSVTYQVPASAGDVLRVQATAYTAPTPFAIEGPNGESWSSESLGSEVYIEAVEITIPADGEYAITLSTPPDEGATRFGVGFTLNPGS